jgi:hypothetical protein
MAGGRSGGRVQVPNTHDRLARRRRLPERPEKARSMGRPPERHEVDKGRAQRLLVFVFDCRFQFKEGALQNTCIPSRFCNSPRPISSLSLGCSNCPSVRFARLTGGEGCLRGSCDYQM